MTRRDSLHVVTSWLTDLANLTAGSTPLADAKTKIAAMALALADEFPPAAFTQPSLFHVSRAHSFFPSHAELTRTLGAWWSEHGPRMAPVVPLLPVAEGDPSLNDEDRAWVRQWLRNEGGDWGRDRDGNPYSGSETHLQMRLARLHHNRPAAYAWLVRENHHAKQIAKHLSLPGVEHDRIDVSETGITRNLLNLEQIVTAGPSGAALASFGLSILRKNVERYAPERLHLLPDAIRPPARNTDPSVRQQDREAAASANAQITALGSVNPAAPKIGRTKADDLAFLDMLRRNPRMPNRDARLAALLDRYRGEAGFEPQPDDPPPPAPAVAAAPPARSKAPLTWGEP